MNGAAERLRFSGAPLVPRIQREREQSLNQIFQHTQGSFLSQFACQSKLHTKPE